jgi:recombination protein RecT
LAGDRGNTIAYYAFALMKTGAKAVHLMTLKEVQDHGKRFSKAYNAKTSPWKTDFDAMAYKTVLIQLADKKLPKATQSEAMMLLAQSVHRDSTNPLLPKDKIGVAIDMDEIIDDTDYEEVQAPEKKVKPKVEVKSKPAEIVEEDEGFVPQSKRQQEIPA